MPLMSQRVHSAQLQFEKERKKELESEIAEKVSCQMRVCKRNIAECQRK